MNAHVSSAAAEEGRIKSESAMMVEPNMFIFVYGVFMPISIAHGVKAATPG